MKKQFYLTPSTAAAAAAAGGNIGVSQQSLLPIPSQKKTSINPCGQPQTTSNNYNNQQQQQHYQNLAQMVNSVVVQHQQSNSSVVKNRGGVAASPSQQVMVQQQQQHQQSSDFTTNQNIMKIKQSQRQMRSVGPNNFPQAKINNLNNEFIKPKTQFHIEDFTSIGGAGAGPNDIPMIVDHRGLPQQSLNPNYLDSNDDDEDDPTFRKGGFFMNNEQRRNEIMQIFEMERTIEGNETFPPSANDLNNQAFDDIGAGMSSIDDSFEGELQGLQEQKFNQKGPGFDFAGDTFSQISSTFEPQGAAQAQFNNYHGVVGGGIAFPSNFAPPQISRSSQMNAGNNLKHNRSVNNQENNHVEQMNVAISGYKQRTANKSKYPQNQSRDSFQEGKSNNNMIICDNKIIDELLDSDILNASGDHIQSPLNGNQADSPLFSQGNRGYRAPSSILLNEEMGALDTVDGAKDQIFLQHQSNFVNQQLLNQQNSTSTITGFNSALFEDPSIMRLLDQTKSVSAAIYQQDISGADGGVGGIGIATEHDLFDDSQHLFESEYAKVRMIMMMMTIQGVQINKKSQGGNSRLQWRCNVFREECEQMAALMSKADQIVKERAGKAVVARNGGSIQMSLEEAQTVTQAIQGAQEKGSILRSLGTAIIHEHGLQSIKMKQYKQNLKVKIHGRLQRYKELCRRQWKGADSRVFKYQVNEFDQNQRIAQLEERLERQSDEINKQANVCEQMRVQKHSMIQQYDQRMQGIESALRSIILSMHDENIQHQQKTSQSFCLGGGDHHSMLLSSNTPVVIQNVRNKYIINNHHMQQQQQQQQQHPGNNVFPSSSQGGGSSGFQHNFFNQRPGSSQFQENQGKGAKNQGQTNQSFLSSSSQNNNNFQPQKKQGNNLKNNLLKLKRMIKDLKAVHLNNQKQLYNEQLNLDGDSQSVLGGVGGLYGVQPIDISNLINYPLNNNEGRHQQESQFINEVVDQAFIETILEDDVDSLGHPATTANHHGAANFNFANMLEEYEGNKNLKDMMHLDDDITDQDLFINNNPNRALTDTKKDLIKKRENLLQKKKDTLGAGEAKFFIESGLSIGDTTPYEESSLMLNSLKNKNQMVDNSIEDDLRILHDELVHPSEIKVNFFNNEISVINESGILHGNALGQDLGSQDPGDFFNNNNDFTGGSISKDQINHSLYSGGSSLIGLNYAFGPQKNTKPQEIMVLKIQDREIQMPKIDIDRVLQLEKREQFQNNLKTSQDDGNLTNPFEPSSQSIVSQVNDSSNVNPLDQKIDSYFHLKQDKKEDDLNDMFKDFKEELKMLDNNKKVNQDDTLDFDDQEMDYRNANSKDVNNAAGAVVVVLLDQEITHQSLHMRQSSTNSQNNAAKRSPMLLKKSLSDSNLLHGQLQDLSEIIDNKPFQNPFQEDSSQNEPQPQTKIKTVLSTVASSQIVQDIPSVNSQGVVKKVIPKGMKIKLQSQSIKHLDQQNTAATATAIESRQQLNIMRISQGGSQDNQQTSSSASEINKQPAKILHKRNVASVQRVAVAGNEISTSKTPTLMMNRDISPASKKDQGQNIGLQLNAGQIQQRPESATNPAHLSPQRKNMIVVSKQLIKLPIKQRIAESPVDPPATGVQAPVRRFIPKRNLIVTSSSQHNTQNQQINNSVISCAADGIPDHQNSLLINSSMIAGANRDQSMLTVVNHQGMDQSNIINYSQVDSSQYASTNSTTTQALAQNILKKIQAGGAVGAGAGARLFKMIKQQQLNSSEQNQQQQQQQQQQQPQQNSTVQQLENKQPQGIVQKKQLLQRRIQQQTTSNINN